MIISDNGEKLQRGVPEVLDFQERVVMFGLALTFFTKIEVCANCTLVSDSLDSINSTFMTNVIYVDDFFLFGFLFLWLDFILDGGFF